MTGLLRVIFMGVVCPRLTIGLALDDTTVSADAILRLFEPVMSSSSSRFKPPIKFTAVQQTDRQTDKTHCCRRLAYL